MTSKENLLRNLRTLSSGTIASLIGSDRYSVIDRAFSTAIIYAAALPEEECKQYQTFEDICRLFKLANGKEEGENDMTNEKNLRDKNGIDRDTLEIMICDFMEDHEEEFKDDPMIFDGKPFLDEDDLWTQSAHDSEHAYELVGDKYGNIRVIPVTIR